MRLLLSKVIWTHLTFDHSKAKTGLFIMVKGHNNRNEIFKHATVKSKKQPIKRTQTPFRIFIFSLGPVSLRRAWNGPTYNGNAYKCNSYTKFSAAGLGSSIERVSARHASGPEFEPHIRHILPLPATAFSLFRWFKKSSCQLLAKECALSTGKLPRKLAQEQCGLGNWPRSKWPKMWMAVKQKWARLGKRSTSFRTHINWRNPIY